MSKLQGLLAKQKLTYQSNENYELIVIASSLKDYRVSFFINQTLLVNLKKVDDLCIDNKSAALIKTFEQFYWQDDLSGMEYFLISNKSSKGVFLSTVKNFDYLLLVKHGDETVDVPFIVDRLKNIEEFQAVVSVNKLNNKDAKLLNTYV